MDSTSSYLFNASGFLKNDSLVVEKIDFENCSAKILDFFLKTQNFRFFDFRKFSMKILIFRFFENLRIFGFGKFSMNFQWKFEISKISKNFVEKFSKSIFSATTKSFFKNPDAFWSYDHGASFYIDSTTFPWPKIR